MIPAPLAALAPVARWLALAGRAGAAADLPSLPEGASLVDVASALRRRGVPATALALERGDVAFVRAPAVIELGDGSRVVLREATRGRCVVEGPTGALVPTTLAELDEGSPRAALEIEPTVAKRRGSLARVLHGLVADAVMRRALGHVVALGVVQLALGMGVPFVTGMALTRALPDAAADTLRLLTLGALAIAAQQSVVSLLRGRAARSLEIRLRDRELVAAFQRVLDLPFARAHGARAGELHEAVHAAELLPSLMVGRIVLPSIDALFALGYVAFVVDGLGAALPAFALATVACLVASGVAAARVARHDADRVTAGAAQRGALYEMLAGLPTLRAAGAERASTGAWLGRLVDELSATFRGQLAATTYAQIVDGVTGALTATLLVTGAQACLDGKLAAGAMIASLQACTTLWSALVQGMRVPIAITSARAIASRADAVFEGVREAAREPALDLGLGARELHAGADAIDVRDLWYRHTPDGPWLFTGLDFRVPAGASVQISWPSGQGKSTLLRILAGLLEPERGTVAVFGRDAARAREQIGYLPQTTVLFAGSLLHNLRLLSGGAPLARILAAASVTGLAALVKTWPMGFETCITQAGGNLSSGQKQLVALTAAIASERPILLLDESTAHLDRPTRQRLERSGAFAGRTVITVVHDVEPADGRLAEAS